MMMEWTLEKIEEEVMRMDKNLNRESDAFTTAVILLSALVQGVNIRKIVRFTGYNDDYVKMTVMNCREAGIFTKRTIHCEWFREDVGGVSFWLDVATAQGLLERVEAN